MDNLASFSQSTADCRAEYVDQPSAATTEAGSARVLSELRALGLPGVIRALGVYDAHWRNQEASKWLNLAGGLSMRNVQTEMELLTLADTAPNQLLFGLAYGKLADLLAFRSPVLTPAHPVVMHLGLKSVVLQNYYDRVMDRGHVASVEFDDAHEDFDLPLGQSREEVARLAEAAQSVPDAFMLGQLLSWIATSHRLHNPQKYAEDLGRLNYGIEASALEGLQRAH